jgi:scyllo-inositol 2-dehydrogenase (NAD+)
VRALLLGYGRMGSMLGEIAARHVPELEICAVVDPAPQALDAARQTLGPAIRATSDPLSALARTDAEACIVATPTPTHAELVTLAIEREIHVFCEKPLSFDVLDSAELGRLAAGQGVILQVGFFRRFSRPWVAAHALVAEHRVGPTVLVKTTTWDRVLPPLAFCDPSVSGGLAVDNGVHELDLLEWLGGAPIARVAAVNAPEPLDRLARVGDVGCVAILAELENGVAGAVDLSRNARYADEMRTEILGTDGAIFVDSVPHGRARLGTSAGLVDVAGTSVEDGFADGVAGELRAFAALARGAERPYPDAFASARATRAALAAQLAAVERSWIDVAATAQLEPAAQTRR